MWQRVGVRGFWTSVKYMPEEDERDSQASNPDGPRQTTAGSIGMWLFIAALAVLFATSILGYVLVRVNATEPPEVAIENHPRAIVKLHTLELPQMLWFSTALVIGVSIAIAIAQFYFKRGLQQPYRKALIAALVLGAGFVTVQTPAMITLMVTHHQQAAEKQNHFYGLLFFLVLLHALHVIGGMIALSRLTIRAQQGAYDSSNPNPTRHAALYWHFLDIVWIVMFTTFYFLR